MKIMKLAIISIVFVALIITIISLFVPSHVQLSQVIQIHAPQRAVMEQIAEPENWRNWYPGAADAQPVKQNGKMIGLVLDSAKGQNLLIDSANENEVMAFFTLRGKRIPTGWSIATATDSSSVTVRWYIDFHLHWYPWEKFTSFVFERVYKPQMKQGLEKLKAWVER